MSNPPKNYYCALPGYYAYFLALILYYLHCYLYYCWNSYLHFVVTDLEYLQNYSQNCLWSSDYYLHYCGRYVCYYYLHLEAKLVQLWESVGAPILRAFSIYWRPTAVLIHCYWDLIGSTFVTAICLSWMTEQVKINCCAISILSRLLSVLFRVTSTTKGTFRKRRSIDMMPRLDTDKSYLSCTRCLIFVRVNSLLLPHNSMDLERWWSSRCKMSLR